MKQHLWFSLLKSCRPTAKMAASFFREAGILGPYVVRCVSSKTLLGGARQCLCRMQLLRHRRHVLQVVRTAAASATFRIEDGKVLSPTDTKKTEKELIEIADPKELYRERYIPITRRSILRFLLEEEGFLTTAEKKTFKEFALALDSAIVNKYHGILHELNRLFDPINPDKDTVHTRQFTRRERLDNEFWMLQKMGDVMERANFYELEKSQVLKLLAEHESSDGIRVSVNPDRYDVLRFWVLGREEPEPEPPLLRRWMNSILKVPVKPSVEYYKRVAVAIRLKKDSKLLLKAFKEIPVNNLEMILPDGTLKMNRLDKGVLTVSLFIAASGLVAKAVTALAHMNLDWMLLVTFVTGVIGIQAWSSYKNRRNAYLVQVSRMLYFKNLANNQGLLASIVSRAEDESFKEALLVYTFLLTSSLQAARCKANKQQASQLGGLTAYALESRVEEWVKNKTGATGLEFDSSEGIHILKSFGLLNESNGKLHVLSLEAALRCLPITPQSLVARAAEADLREGYDRDMYLETEHEYKEEEKRTSRYGWF